LDNFGGLRQLIDKMDMPPRLAALVGMIERDIGPIEEPPADGIAEIKQALAYVDGHVLLGAIVAFMIAQIPDEALEQEPEGGEDPVLDEPPANPEADGAPSDETEGSGTTPPQPETDAERALKPADEIEAEIEALEQANEGAGQPAQQDGETRASEPPEPEPGIKEQAEKLAAANTRKQLDKIVKAEKVEDVTADNNKIEVAYKILRHREAAST
jgi:hypothetical protein